MSGGVGSYRSPWKLPFLVHVHGVGWGDEIGILTIEVPNRNYSFWLEFDCFDKRGYKMNDRRPVRVGRVITAAQAEAQDGDDGDQGTYRGTYTEYAGSGLEPERPAASVDSSQGPWTGRYEKDINGSTSNPAMPKVYAPGPGGSGTTYSNIDRDLTAEADAVFTWYCAAGGIVAPGPSPGLTHREQHPDKHYVRIFKRAVVFGEAQAEVGQWSQQLGRALQAMRVRDGATVWPRNTALYPFSPYMSNYEGGYYSDYLGNASNGNRKPAGDLTDLGTWANGPIIGFPIEAHWEDYPMGLFRHSFIVNLGNILSVFKAYSVQLKIGASYHPGQRTTGPFGAPGPHPNELLTVQEFEQDGPTIRWDVYDNWGKLELKEVDTTAGYHPDQAKVWVSRMTKSNAPDMMQGDGDPHANAEYAPAFPFSTEFVSIFPAQGPWIATVRHNIGDIPSGRRGYLVVTHPDPAAG